MQTSPSARKFKSRSFNSAVIAFHVNVGTKVKAK